MEQKKKKSSMHNTAAKKLIRLLLILLVVVLYGLCSWRGRWFGYQLFADTEDASRSEGVIEFTVSEDESVYEVAVRLKKMGILDSVALFCLQSKLFSIEPIPGTYTVHDGMSSRYLLNRLSGLGFNR